MKEYINRKVAIGLLFSTFIFTGCGGGSSGDSTTVSSSGNPSSTNTPSPPNGIPSTTDATRTMQDLERDGLIPVLDKSTTLTGVDSNNNGIRDDIEQWIQKKGYDEPKKKAAEQLARTFQKTLSVSASDNASLQATIADMVASISCAYSKFSSGGNVNAGKEIVRELRNYTMNTEVRAMKYLELNHAMSGAVIDLPTSNSCA